MINDLASVDWAKVIQAAGPLAVAIVTLASSLRAPGRARAHLAADVALLEKLPEGTLVREALIQLISTDLEAVSREHIGRRDIGMLAVSLVSAPALTYLTIYLAQAGTWWQILLAVGTGTLGLIFVFGIFETSARVPRDAKGIRIPTG